MMNYNNTNFRQFLNHFSVFPLNEYTKAMVNGIAEQDVQGADGVMAYGFYDRKEGLTFEVIILTKNEGEDYIGFKEISDHERHFFRPGIIAEEEFEYFDYDREQVFRGAFSEKLNALKIYEASEDIKRSREMEELDDSRDPVYIDHIYVTLLKEGLEPEASWVKITGLGENEILGVLDQEPLQDFGYHELDPISFSCVQQEDGTFICKAELL